MQIVPAFLLFLALNPIVPSNKSPNDSTRPITDADAVVAIYVEDWRLASLGTPKLILVVWGDGHVVWSEDQVNGGAPYRSGQVSAKRVAAMLTQIAKDGAFDDQKLRRPRFGPDSRFTTILVKAEGRELEMQSWHELFEQHGKTVETSAGLEPLSGRRRLDVLRQEPADYLYYRFFWSEIRETVARLIPSENASISGEILMKHGVVSWRESATKSKR